MVCFRKEERASWFHEGQLRSGVGFSASFSPELGLCLVQTLLVWTSSPSVFAVCVSNPQAFLRPVVSQVKEPLSGTTGLKCPAPPSD